MSELRENIYLLFPCISCGIDADEADGFGRCTCGNEKKREQLEALFQSELEKAKIEARIDELENLPNCNIESKYHGSTHVVLMVDLIKRIAELESQKEKGGKV